MPAQAKTVTESTTVKEIKTDFIPFIEEKRNYTIKKQKEDEIRDIGIKAAEDYEEKLKRERIAKAKLKAKIKEYIILGIMYLLLIGAIVFKVSDMTSNANETEKTNYEVTNEEPSRVYAIGKLCEVVEINESENIVTVECNENLYDFYGNGYFVGQTILCKFTEKMELVDVIE